MSNGNVETRAGANPDGTPTHVTPGAPVESEWGNAVVDTLMGVKANNDAQNPTIAANTQAAANAHNAANAAQGTANAAQGAASAAHGAANTAQGTANQAINRTQWLRENDNDTAHYASQFYLTTNGNGEFWCVFPFTLDIDSAIGFLQVADINIGAWCVVAASSNNQVHGRMFSPSGIVANLAVAVNCYLIGHRATGFP